MDNVSIHKVEGVREAIERRGAILVYLSAYSPDLNPIEQMFSKLTSVLRKVTAYTLKGNAYSTTCSARRSPLTVHDYRIDHALHVVRGEQSERQASPPPPSSAGRVLAGGFIYRSSRAGATATKCGFRQVLDGSAGVREAVGKNPSVSPA
jgi:hypothetical protein